MPLRLSEDRRTAETQGEKAAKVHERKGHHRRTQSCEAGAQGFEPCRAALETACSPRSTLLFRVSGGNRTRRLDLHRVACLPSTPRTPLVISDLRPDSKPKSQIRNQQSEIKCASTRNRTRNVSFEARHDIRFTIEAAEGEGVEPSSPHG